MRRIPYQVETGEESAVRQLTRTCPPTTHSPHLKGGNTRFLLSYLDFVSSFVSGHPLALS